MNLHPVVERTIQKQHTRTAVNTLFQKQAESQFLAEKLAEFLASGGQIVAGQNAYQAEMYNVGAINDSSQDAKKRRSVAGSANYVATRQAKAEKLKESVFEWIRAGKADCTAELMGLSGVSHRDVRAALVRLCREGRIFESGKRINTPTYALSKEYA